ncbi:MAG TPA: UDP-N-acetylmuramoyl-tripeptide--D-alanyl-D-alanine ligase [Actinomycetota bacterium]|nr:UDP-N-acetylmuramoyl-tripeptide--D-alanyl-D-alanine ligase [Actinomycetota bacterium]
MSGRTLGEVAAVTGGSVDAEAAAIEYGSVSIDSRNTRPGDLFVAIRGERSDGHRFVRETLDAGAAGALVQKGAPIDGRPEDRLVEVDDTRAALLELARAARSTLPAAVVGITGSTGKTCTKDMTTAVLKQRFKVVASRASFNNEVGLPLTILEAGDDTDVIVCEMGSRGPGHIRLLCDVARPHVGVVTNVGVAHMELFGSPEVLRAAKRELPEALPHDGAAVLNADDPVVKGYASHTNAKPVFFGRSDDAEVRAERIELSRQTGKATFRLVTPSGSAPVALPVPGEHMVPNALAAAAVGAVLGVTADETAKGLAGAHVSGSRMDVFKTRDGMTVVDDSYNANPTSMSAALRAARWMAGDGRCIAVLGTMAELGPISMEEHERIGELLVRLGIDDLVTVGEEARLIAAGAEREGLEPQHIQVCDDVSQALWAVRSLARPGDLVLVKASRAAGLERLAEALRSDQAAVESAP